MAKIKAKKKQKKSVAVGVANIKTRTPARGVLQTKKTSKTRDGKTKTTLNWH